MKLTANQVILLLSIHVYPNIDKLSFGGTFESDIGHLKYINLIQEAGGQFFITENGKEVINRIREVLNPEEVNPLNKLSEIALRFLLDRTNWEEPYCGLGFALEFKNEVERALHRKTKVRIW